MRHGVLSTNILVWALHTPGGTPRQVLAAVKEGRLQPVFSRAVFAKYAQVLHRPRVKLDPARLDAALQALRIIGTQLTGLEPLPPAGLPDAPDWPFIACALAASCPVVTGNAKDFPARLGVRVTTAREWAESFGPG